MSINLCPHGNNRLVTPCLDCVTQSIDLRTHIANASTDWEKAFDELTSDYDTFMPKVYIAPATEQIKSFISALIEQREATARAERDKEIATILQNTVLQHIPDDSARIPDRMIKDFVLSLTSQHPYDCICPACISESEKKVKTNGDENNAR